MIEVDNTENLQHFKNIKGEIYRLIVESIIEEKRFKIRIKINTKEKILLKNKLMEFIKYLEIRKDVVCYYFSTDDLYFIINNAKKGDKIYEITL